MKPFTAHSWLEFWFYGLYPARTSPCLSPYLKRLRHPGLVAFHQETYRTTMRELRKPWSTNSMNKDTDNRNPDRGHAFDVPERHPADPPEFRYSFIPPSPFGAGTPLRIPSLRSNSPFRMAGTPIRVRSLRHFLLPSPLSQNQIEGHDEHDGVFTPDRGLTAVPEDMRGGMLA
ncbi:hypothetical protein EJ02DRAFT_178248 [Clathrospora elynae]|uniref:Uncharacterized protein n=1 Tax=Clathrospora elynae TaxID=706981 RepID=A0A6A5SR94_9PLEO|nr:hypothetical protein EJ02DRAFT_178248 [Clathrospora elynae]